MAPLKQDNLKLQDTAPATWLRQYQEVIQSSKMPIRQDCIKEVTGIQFPSFAFCHSFDFILSLASLLVLG
jgi:hypothetical protein